MIFRNKSVVADESGLYVDDILTTDCETIPKEIIAKLHYQKGKQSAEHLGYLT